MARWLRSTAPTTFDSRTLQNEFPTEADLSPAGIGNVGADLKISHLALDRNIYYIADRFPGRKPISDYHDNSPRPDLADPSTWALSATRKP